MDSGPEKSRAEVIGASAGEAALGGGGGGGSPPGAGREEPVAIYQGEVRLVVTVRDLFQLGVVDDG